MILEIPPQDLTPSPTNPRKRGLLDGIEGMTESVRAKGVLQPIVVRRLRANKYEVVFGHRRREAAVRAKLELVPCLVREMSDDEVLEAQLVENMEREDVHPLDEAEGFAALLKRGHTIGYIAEKVGRPASFVAQRLKLLDLGKECRDALDAGRISVGVALVIARVPAKLQERALREIEDASYDGPLSAQAARELVQKDFMLRLVDAPWQLNDAKLAKKAGACTACPKRTGNQAVLFADVSDADLCTDPGCYRDKLDAVWALRKKADADKFANFLDGKEASTALHSYQGKYVKLDGKEWTSGGKELVVRKVFGKNLPPITLAQDQNSGRHVELVLRADFDRVLREKAKAKGVDVPPERDDYKAQQKRAEKKLKLRRAAITRAITHAVAKAGKVDQRKVLAFVVQAFAARIWNETQRAILDRRGIAVDQRLQADGTLVKLAKSLDGDQLTGLGIELALRSFAPWASHFDSPSRTATWKELLGLVGVDFAALEKEVAAEDREKAKAKGTKSAKKSPKRAAPVSKAAPDEDEDDGADEPEDGVCRECGCTDLDACPGGCHWVEPDLCSQCASKGKKAPKKRAKTA